VWWGKWIHRVLGGAEVIPEISVMVFFGD
jgi:hypothetical protein